MPAAMARTHARSIAKEASEAWTEAAEPALVLGPVPGPFYLGPAGGGNGSGGGNVEWAAATLKVNASLPALAVIVDGDSVHRGMAHRLAQRGFPMAGCFSLQLEPSCPNISMILVDAFRKSIMLEAHVVHCWEHPTERLLAV
jgi:hypothetical protein